MNAQQQAMYFAEWGKLRDVLRATRGLNNAALELYRHDVTRRALGVAKSSKHFTNADLDRVLARIKAEREPDNLDAQLALQESPEARRKIALQVCDDACWKIYDLGGNNGFARSETRLAYIGGIARKVIRKELADCTAEDLAVVHGILGRQLDRVRRAHAATAPAVDRPFDGPGDPY